MKSRFTNYFHFSRNERFGLIALLSICVLAFSTPALLQWIRPKSKTDFSAFEATIQAFRKAAAARSEAENFDFDPNLASAADFEQLGLSEKVAQNICRFREKGGAFRKPEDFKKIWSLAAEDYNRLLPYIHISQSKTTGLRNDHSPEDPEYFPFDPNTASAAELYKLGLPKNTINSILNYREKGGVFRKKEDLGKIYSLRKEDYDRIEPFISISLSNKYSSNSKSSAVIDINSASVDTWKTLPMIGAGRASQLVKFRERLGGFSAIEQVAELYNLPDSVYQAIRPFLSVQSNRLQKININAASLEDLRAHPYISWKQADLICAYRVQHGPYANVEEVLKIKAFTDMAWWEKLSPYLTVE